MSCLSQLTLARRSRSAGCRLAFAAALVISSVSPLSTATAQKAAPAPKRPRTETADTNDAKAYFDYGLRNIQDKPDAAADAFYWAARIDPGMADALYGRRTALLLADETQLRRMMTGNGRNPSKKDLSLDSLLLRSIMLRPLLFRRFDVQLLRTYYINAIGGDYTASTRPSDIEINAVLERALREGGPEMRGWLAYARSDFRNALSGYAEAMKGTKETARLRIERGRIFGMQGQPDSAIAEFQKALVELRKKDSKDVVVLYNSKAVIEQAIGMMYEAKDDAANAREAYGRALSEDLAYWPSHISLGMMAATAKDTNTALSEFALATEIASNEAYVHAFIGSALVNLGRTAEAMAPLKKAVALEPFYALPHMALGKLYEAANAKAEAIASYEGFLARASRLDTQRAFATERINALKNPLN